MHDAFKPRDRKQHSLHTALPTIIVCSSHSVGNPVLTTAIVIAIGLSVHRGADNRLRGHYAGTISTMVPSPVRASTTEAISAIFSGVNGDAEVWSVLGTNLLTVITSVCSISFAIVNYLV